MGLLNAVHSFRRDHAGADELAREACEIEIDRLHRSVGKQDQYAAAYGGHHPLRLRAGRRRRRRQRVALSSEALHDLQEHLLMFFTGYSRAADEVLADQNRRTLAADPEMQDNLHRTKDLGLRGLAALETGDTAAFADLMHEHWENKRRRSGGISNPRIDHLYDVGRANSARGGKLVGAGAGGFLMFYADEPRRLRPAMREEGLDGAALQLRPRRLGRARPRVAPVQCVILAGGLGTRMRRGLRAGAQDPAAGGRPPVRRLAAGLAGRRRGGLGRLLHRPPRRHGA